jgi:hypothetical protein
MPKSTSPVDGAPRPLEHLIVTRQPALEFFLVVILSEAKDLRGAIPFFRMR